MLTAPVLNCASGGMRSRVPPFSLVPCQTGTRRPTALPVWLPGAARGEQKPIEAARAEPARAVSQVVTPRGVEPRLPNRKSGVLNRWTMGPQRGCGPQVNVRAQ